MKGLRVWLIGLLVLSLLVVVASGCTGGKPKSYKIGIFSPTTGFAAADGTSALHGAELAVKYINDHGGINGVPLELVHYDDAAKPDQAVNVAHKLIEQDKVVAAVSGSYSGATRAAAGVFQEAGVPMIAGYAVHPEITKTGPMIWRTGTLAVVEGRVGGALAVDKLGAKRIALLTIDNDFGVSLAESFKEYVVAKGAEIVFEEKYPLGEKEFRPILNRIKDANPDVVYASGYYNEAANIVRQAKEVGLEATIIGQEGYDSPKFLELAGDAAEGVIITTDLNRDSEREITQWYIKTYKETYGIEADMVGASTFDAVMVLAYALRNGGTKPEQITKALSELKDFNDAVTGPFYRFTEGREVMRPVTAQVVKGGTFRFYAEFEDPALITPPW